MDMLISLIVMIATGVAVWRAAPYHAKLIAKPELPNRTDQVAVK